MFPLVQLLDSTVVFWSHVPSTKTKSQKLGFDGAMTIMAHFPCQVWTLKSITKQLASKTWIFLCMLHLHFQKWMNEWFILFNPWRLRSTGHTHTHTHTDIQTFLYIPLAALFSCFSDKFLPWNSSSIWANFFVCVRKTRNFKSCSEDRNDCGQR
jgi:hypothetical protein